MVCWEKPSFPAKCIALTLKANLRHELLLKFRTVVAREQLNVNERCTKTLILI